VFNCAIDFEQFSRLERALFAKLTSYLMKEHAVGQPLDLSYFQAHVLCWREKCLCNSGEAGRFFFIQQNNHFHTRRRVWQPYGPRRAR
jgi:hypothetical protein